MSAICDNDNEARRLLLFCGWYHSTTAEPSDTSCTMPSTKGSSRALARTMRKSSGTCVCAAAMTLSSLLALTNTWTVSPGVGSRHTLGRWSCRAVWHSIDVDQGVDLETLKISSWTMLQQDIRRHHCVWNMTRTWLPSSTSSDVVQHLLDRWPGGQTLLDDLPVEADAFRSLRLQPSYSLELLLKTILKSQPLLGLFEHVPSHGRCESIPEVEVV